MAERPRHWIDDRAQDVLNHCKDLGCFYVAHDNDGNLRCRKKLLTSVLADNVWGGCSEIIVESDDHNYYESGKISGFRGKFVADNKIPRVVEP